VDPSAGTVAGASEQQPSTTPPTTTTPAPTTTTPGAPKTEDTVEYWKNKAADEERRRKGLDRQVTQLRGRRSQQTATESALTDDERTVLDKSPEYQKLLLAQAERELQDSAADILEQYPNIPEHIANQIKKNPRGFIKSTTDTVEDATLDIEEYVADLASQFPEGGAATLPKQVKVGSPNATSTSAGEFDWSSLKTPEDVDAAIAQNLITEAQYEAHIKDISHPKK
jgi:hypothetical protein